MRRSKIMQQAKETIDSQEATPLSIKRSAWILFQHQLSRTNPATGKLFDVAANLEAARDVVGGAERKNRERNRATGEDAAGPRDGAIATRDHYAFSVADRRRQLRLIVNGTNHRVAGTLDR